MQCGFWIISRGLGQAFLILQPSASPLCSEIPAQPYPTALCSACASQRKEAPHESKILLKEVSDWALDSIKTKPPDWPKAAFSALPISPWIWCLSFSRATALRHLPLTVPGDEGHCHLRRALALRRALVHENPGGSLWTRNTDSATPAGDPTDNRQGR